MLESTHIPLNYKPGPSLPTSNGTSPVLVDSWGTQTILRLRVRLFYSRLRASQYLYPSLSCPYQQHPIPLACTLLPPPQLVQPQMAATLSTGGPRLNRARQ